MTPPRVLAISLDPDRVPGSGPAAADAEQDLAGLAENGADVTSCLLALDGFVDAATQAEKAIQAGPWDVVVLTGPLATNPEHAVLREDVTAAVQRYAPGARVDVAGSAAGIDAVHGRTQD